ncbi:MAG: hypothetical protein Q9184_008197 [Pyrenodesmia sp. 2 TL-2023]
MLPVGTFESTYRLLKVLVEQSVQLSELSATANHGARQHYLHFWGETENLIDKLERLVEDAYPFLKAL